ncbi:MAG: gamma-glutamyltransferase family protein, partial [Rhizobacter sp.]|nr:gamma-glutamyltransferase family protein [Rhizobacter sp.]
MTHMDWTFPHRSQRMPLLADNVVVTSQPLAARAGLLMLEKGGNAVDAALAAAITLTVVEPVMNGVGSDTQVLLTHGDDVIGLNSSGRSPAAWSDQ